LGNLPSFSNAAAISRASLAVEVKYNNVSVNSSSAHPRAFAAFHYMGLILGMRLLPNLFSPGVGTSMFSVMVGLARCAEV
jgi:hypothetical protein